MIDLRVFFLESPFQIRGSVVRGLPRRRHRRFYRGGSGESGGTRAGVALRRHLSGIVFGHGGVGGVDGGARRIGGGIGGGG